MVSLGTRLSGSAAPAPKGTSGNDSDHMAYATRTQVKRDITALDQSWLAAVMAAPVPKTKRPVLISKLEGHGDVVNCALCVPGENAVISVSDDK